MHSDEVAREVEFHKQQQQLTAGELEYLPLPQCVYTKSREFINLTIWQSYDPVLGIFDRLVGFEVEASAWFKQWI